MGNSGKSAGKSAATPKPGLVPQRHGGALYRGGVPGNRGGWKPPSAIRARLWGSLDDRVKVLEDIADDPTMAAGDRIRAVDVLAKYGLGAATELTVDQVRERLARTVTLVREALPADLAEPLLRRMQEVWAWARTGGRRTRRGRGSNWARRSGLRQARLGSG